MPDGQTKSNVMELFTDDLVKCALERDRESKLLKPQSSCEED